MKGIFISYSYCDKVAQISGLKQHNFITVQFRRVYV